MKSPVSYYKTLTLDLWVLSIAVIAIRARLAGMDISYLNSDTLYFPLLHDYGLTGFRPASNSFLFPDYIIYSLLSLFSDRPLESLKLLGIIQVFLVSTLAYYLTERKVWLLAMIGGMSFPEFTYFAVETHVSFILLAWLFVALDGWPRLLAILIGGISDPLFLSVPCLFYLLELMSGNPIHRNRVACVITTAWSIAFFLSETTKELLLTSPFLFLWLCLLYTFPRWFPAASITESSGSLAARLSEHRSTRELLAMALLLAGSVLCLAGMPLRYGIPMLAMGAILLRSDRGKSPWKLPRSLAISLLAVISLFPQMSRAYQMPETMVKDIACLKSTLARQDINGVGVDYWLSKPLYYAVPYLKVIPMDYACGEPYIWVAPYEFGRGSVRDFIMDDRLCESHDKSLNKHCDHEWILQNTHHQELLCEHYTLYFSENYLSFDHPASKLESFIKHALKNMRKIGGRKC